MGGGTKAQRILARCPSSYFSHYLYWKHNFLVCNSYKNLVALQEGQYMKCLETKLLIDDMALAYFYRYKPQEEKRKKKVFCIGILMYDVCNVIEPLEMPVNATMGYVLNPAEDQIM